MEKARLFLVDKCIEELQRKGINLDASEDRRLENFYDKLISWIDQIENENKELYLKLIENIDYLDRGKIAKELEVLFVKLCKEFQDDDFNSTIYMPVGSKGGKLNGAMELINLFQRINDPYIVKGQIVIQLNEIFDPYNIYQSNEKIIEDIKNLVLLDDIIGTGTTVVERLKYLNEYYGKIIEGKNIYILCIGITEKGFKRIEEYKHKNNMPIKIIACKNYSPVFSGCGDLSGLSESQLSVIKKKEKEIAIREIDIMGYKKSQLLLAFYYNTPNNTLSCIWEVNEEKNWQGLLPRIGNGSRAKIPKLSDLQNKKKNIENSKKIIFGR